MGNAEIERCHILHFFSCLFPAPSEAPPSCEVKNRSRHKASVSWKVMTLTFSVGGKTTHALYSAACMVCCMYGVLHVIARVLGDLSLENS